MVEATRTMRLLKMLVWARYIRMEGIAPGALAVRCASCPRPGVNMPPNWKSNPKR